MVSFESHPASRLYFRGMSFLRRTCWFIPALVIASPALAKDEGPKPVPWSFAPLRQVDLPPVKDKTWPRTRMDHFILARQEAAGMKPAVRADERTLSRRLAFDLTGLPPQQQKDAETRRHGDAEGQGRQATDRIRCRADRSRGHRR